MYICGGNMQKSIVKNIEINTTQIQNIKISEYVLHMQCIG